MLIGSLILQVSNPFFRKSNTQSKTKTASEGDELPKLPRGGDELPKLPRGGDELQFGIADYQSEGFEEKDYMYPFSIFLN